MSVPTPHLEAAEGDFAPNVLLPGDPRRAAYIAERFFEGPRQVNQVRNAFGFTGTYQGVPVSVLGSGMGMPSIGESGLPARQRWVEFAAAARAAAAS